MNIKLPEESKNSRKWEQGRVLIVWWSHTYYGAPIMNGLWAEKWWADLIHLFLPSIHSEAAKNYSLNFQVNPFKWDNISDSDIDSILKLSKQCHSMLIWSGMDHSIWNSKECIIKILEKSDLPTVIDAGALFPEILDIKRKAIWTITPHDKEFERLFWEKPDQENLREFSKKYDITILKKWPTDLVSWANNHIFENKTWHYRMRVWWTWDVLAWLVTSLISQWLSPYDACISWTHMLWKCWEKLAETQFSYTAQELANALPIVMSELWEL